MAALLMAGELRIGRLKRAVGRIPTSKDVTGIGRRLKGNLRTAVCKDAARLDGATLCRIGEGHADGIDGHKGRGNNTAPGFTASFGDQRGLVLKALQAPVDIPAPEQKAWMGLGRQMKGLPQLEFVGRGLHHGPVARHGTAEPRVGRDHDLGL